MPRDVPASSPDDPATTPATESIAQPAVGIRGPEAKAQAFDRLTGLDDPAAAPSRPTPKSAEALRTEAKAQALDRLMEFDDSQAVPARPMPKSAEALQVEAKVQALDRFWETGRMPAGDVGDHPSASPSPAERKAALLDQRYDSALPVVDAVPADDSSDAATQAAEQATAKPDVPVERRELPGIHPPDEPGAVEQAGPSDQQVDVIVPWVPEIPPKDTGGAPLATEKASAAGDQPGVENAPATPAPTTDSSMTDPPAQAKADVPLPPDLASDPVAGEGTSDSLPDVVPLSDPRLTHVFDTKVDTPAGRAYFRVGDPIVVSSLKAIPEPGHFTADLHGNPDVFQVDGEVLDAGDLAQVIRADPGWRGQPVRLISCETGKGDNPIAQKLADELGVPVKAPTELAFVDRGTGEVYTSSLTYNSVGRPIVKVPYDGSWVTFHPGNEER